MKRRAFLAGLGASIGAVSTVSYFDLGPSWAKNEAGLYVPDLDGFDLSEAEMDETDLFVTRAEKLLKEYYRSDTVQSLTFHGDPFVLNMRSL